MVENIPEKQILISYVWISQFLILRDTSSY
jgi:hypothetical protein